MNANAVPHSVANPLSWLVAAVVALAVLALASPGSAAAKPIGKDGRIYACYKVKGKPKGALRVLVNQKRRCKRGERRVVWFTAGPGGREGAAGQQGASGQPGASGAGGTSEPSLGANVSSLGVKVGGLEDLLQGITATELTEAVGSLADLEALCNQATALTSQISLLEGVIGGLGLNGVLEALGGLLEVPALPQALEPFACPTP